MIGHDPVALLDRVAALDAPAVVLRLDRTGVDGLLQLRCGGPGRAVSTEGRIRETVRTLSHQITLPTFTWISSCWSSQVTYSRASLSVSTFASLRAKSVGTTAWTWLAAAISAAC